MSAHREVSVLCAHAGATTGRKRKTEAGPTPPKSKRKKAKIPPGTTSEQAEKDNLLGVILRKDNPYKLLTRIQIDWIRNELLKLLEATVIRLSLIHISEPTRPY